MRMPLWYRRFRITMKRRRIPREIPILIIFALLFVMFWNAFNARFRPLVETMATSRASNRISETVCSAVSDCVAQQHLTYQDFITVGTDGDGRITSLSSNLSSASMLKSRLVEYVTEDLQQLRQEEFGIPLGTLTGWVLFSERGPNIQVQLLSFGDVNVQMHHNFEEAGINQTLHQVFLDVSVTVYLMIPGKTLSATVESPICVAETVIVGQVPETYLYIGNGEHG